MNIEPKYLNALQSLGYTGSQASFLYLVATHSGYFTARQFLAFTGAHWGSRTANFWSKIVRLRHARTVHFPGCGVLHHVSSPQLYRQLAKESFRNRRAHEINSIKRRLAILDFVIANQQYHYLETEAAKVSYFCERLRIDSDYLPARRLDHKTSGSTTLYFVDRFPMFLAPPSPVVTFTYVPEGTAGFPDFVQHLNSYLPLFRQLSEFTLLYVSSKSFQFPRATEIFDSLVKLPLESDIASDLLRYFRVRKLWDERQYNAVADAELVYRNKARVRFQGETFEELYRNWKNGHISSAAIEEKFMRNDRRRTIGFGTCQIGRIQVSIGEPQESGADGQNSTLQPHLLQARPPKE
jgi:hypothetical protein